MGRIYSIQVNAVTVSAAQDIFEVLANSAKPFVLHEIVITQSSDYGDAQAEGLTVLIKRASGTYTSGSGGSSPSVNPHTFSDAAAGVTAEANNTSQASAGTGALTTVRAEAFNIQSGWQYLPTPETRMLFSGSQACVVSITAPSDAVTLSATMVIEEMG